MKVGRIILGDLAIAALAVALWSPIVGLTPFDPNIVRAALAVTSYVALPAAAVLINRPLLSLGEAEGPHAINPEVREKILAGEKPIEGRYAETLPADLYEKAEKQLGDTARCEEDVLSYIAFPQVAEKFFAERKAREEKKVRYSIEQL